MNIAIITIPREQFATEYDVCSSKYKHNSYIEKYLLFKNFDKEIWLLLK